MPHDATTELIDRPSRLSPALLIWSAFLIVIGFSLICGGILLGMRRGYEDLAHQTAENLAVSIDADVSRNIELYDLSLIAVVNNIKIPEVMEASASLKRLILFDHSTTAQHLGSVQILDETGNVVMDSQTTTLGTQNAFDEEFFQVHRKDPIFGLISAVPRRGMVRMAWCSAAASADGTERSGES